MISDDAMLCVDESVIVRMIQRRSVAYVFFIVFSISSMLCILACWCLRSARKKKR